MTHQTNYIDLIVLNHPGVYCSTPTPDIYESIVWDHGDPLPSKETLDAEWVVFSKRAASDRINSYRDDYYLGTQGFWFQGNLYECDALAKSNVTGAITAVVVGATLPSNYTWRSKDNQNIPMNAQTLSAMGVSMGAYITTIFSWTWQLKAKIDSMTDVDAIQSFDPASYWPNNNYDGTGPGGVTTMQALQAAAAKLATDYP